MNMRTTGMVALLAGATLVLVGCGSDDTEVVAAGAATEAVAGVIEVEAGDMYFDPEVISASAGEIAFTLVNTGAAEHDLVIEEAGDTQVVFVAPGETASGTIELSAGTYTYYCSVPGHRSMMEGTLEVE
jgi:plastocyanin